MPVESIEERLGLGPGEGARHVFVRSCLHGTRRGCFLYPNQDSGEIGIVVGGEDTSSKEIQSSTFMDRLRKHPKIRRLIKGGKTVEYDAHMIPEAGPKMLTRPYTDGMLVAGDAAGHLLNNGYTFRGVDIAIQAGVAAAQTLLEARKKQDYSAGTLQAFERKLLADPPLKDMYTFN